MSDDGYTSMQSTSKKMTKVQVISLLLVGSACFWAGKNSVSKDVKVGQIDQPQDLQSLITAQSNSFNDNSDINEDQDGDIARWGRNNHQMSLQTPENEDSDDEDDDSDSDDSDSDSDSDDSDSDQEDRPLMGRGDHDYNRFTRGDQDNEQDQNGPLIGGGDHDYNRFTDGDEDSKQEEDDCDEEDEDLDEDSDSEMIDLEGPEESIEFLNLIGNLMDINKNSQLDEAQLINLRRNGSSQRSRKIRSSKVDKFVDLTFKSVDLAVDFVGLSKSQAQSTLKKMLGTVNKSSLFSQKKFDAAWKESDQNLDKVLDSKETKNCIKNFLNRVGRLNDDNKSFSQI